MNNLLSSFTLDFLAVLGLFCCCYVFVIGIKYIKDSVVKLIQKVNAYDNPPPKKRKESTKKTTKSIEINPDEIERIYMKKSS